MTRISPQRTTVDPNLTKQILTSTVFNSMRLTLVRFLGAVALAGIAVWGSVLPGTPDGGSPRPKPKPAYCALQPQDLSAVENVGARVS